jgi:hypothetical protein
VADKNTHIFLERLAKKWDAVAYAFFELYPEIVTRLSKDKTTQKRYLQFKCRALSCLNKGPNGRYVYRELEGNNLTSTKGLLDHIKGCWGTEAIAKVGRGETTKDRRKALKGVDNRKLREGSIVLTFDRTGKGPVTYLTRPPTKAEIKAFHVRWVAESQRPFEIVKDPAYLQNMKEGRPEQYVPSPTTVRRDVKVAFARCREKISRLLRVRTNQYAL